jgi:hypothetical protein
MPSRRQKLAIRALLIAMVFVLGYAGAVGALYFWKEDVHHYASGARAELLALHTIQENYLNDHGTYAGTFYELGAPLGASVRNDELIWDDAAYHFRITRSIRDQNGKIVHYTIEARANESLGRRLPTMTITDEGRVEQ